MNYPVPTRSNKRYSSRKAQGNSAVQPLQLITVSQTLPSPSLGNIQLVIYSDVVPIILVSFPATSLDKLLSNVEARRGIQPEARNDAHFQIGGRLYIYDVLAKPDLDHALRDYLASEILWLAVNHYGQTGEIRAEIDNVLAEHGCAVLSVSIATGESDSLPGTRWGVTVDITPHDARAEVASLQRGTTRLFGKLIADDDPNPRR